MFSKIGIKNFYKTEIIKSGNYEIKKEIEDFVVHEINQDSVSSPGPILDIQKFYESKKIFENIPETVPKDKRKYFYDATKYYPFLKLSCSNDKFSVKENKNEKDIFVCTLMKYNLNIVDAIKIIAKNLEVSPQYIQFSGSKDKRAVTYQEISINCTFEKLLSYSLALNRCNDSNKCTDSNKCNDSDRCNDSNKCNDSDRCNDSYKCNDSDKCTDSNKCNDSDRCNDSNNYSYMEYNKFDNENSEIINEMIKEGINIEKMDVYDRLRISNIRKGSSIKMGDHIGNKFVIKIRNLSEINYKPLYFLNYFGQQRFGNNLNNHIIGGLILESKYDEALDLIMEEKYRDIKSMEENERDIKSMEENERDIKSMEEKERDIKSMEENERDIKSMEENERDIKSMEENERDIKSMEENERDIKSMEEKERDIKSMEEKERDIKSMEEKDRDIKSMEEKERDIKSMEENEKLSPLQKYIKKMIGKKVPSKIIIHKMDRLSRMMYMHAYQSHIFNCEINKRVESGKIESEDLIFEDGKYIKAKETSKFEDIYISLETKADKFLKGGQRKMIEEIKDFSYKKDKEDIIVSFSLNKSSYATCALREIIGNYYRYG